ncbi:MAG TPA: (d)CMP kinase [Acidimicrobiales bacterium]|nr:(d)CMP kinase [Acidimicrobiales bacterium]
MKVIAIDGPAGSGKSTVARAVARRLHLDYLDTGAMYRSVAFVVLQQRIDPADLDAVARLAEKLTIDVGERVTVDGVDATDAIRSPEVTKAVSAVAANPEVRKELVRRQQEWADAHGGGVVEGRDIGTVVFPQAELKVYLTASDEERARRRAAEIGRLHEADTVAADIARRDRLDSTRAASPLTTADGAVVIDTSNRTIDDIVEEVLSHL